MSFTPGGRLHWCLAHGHGPDARPRPSLPALEPDYIAQDYPLEPGQKCPRPSVSDGFAQSLQSFFGPVLPELLQHPNWHLHVLTSRGQRWLNRPTRRSTMAGFAGLAMSNLISRRLVPQWLERNVLSGPGCLAL